MTNLFLHRFISAALSMTLALGPTTCGEPDRLPGTGEPVPDVMSDEAEASLQALRDEMATSNQLAGAVAYLGYREPGDFTPMADWLQENCFWLTYVMPFLLEIPEERILGAGYGDLYCIVPRDGNTSLAVNHVKWETADYGVWPVADEVLYREEYGQPVLVFVNFEQWYDETDTEIVLVTNDGVEVSWCPVVDPYGIPDVPIGEDYIPMLMDFTMWGDPNGLDSPEGWDPSGDGWWLPPTDWGLADTSWDYENWSMDLHWGDSGPNFSGTVDLYHRTEEGQLYEHAYSGNWCMNGDCLWLEIWDGAGTYISGNFPVLIDPSGEYLYIEQDWENGVRPPFFGEETYCIDLTRSYG